MSTGGSKSAAGGTSASSFSANEASCALISATGSMLLKHMLDAPQYNNAETNASTHSAWLQL